MNRLLLLAPRIATNRLWARAGEVPSFHIAPARTQNARDLITGSVIGTYNSASPALAVGPDGVLFQPAANAPVIEYDLTTGACLGARIWGVVTNEVRNSNNYSAVVTGSPGTLPANWSAQGNSNGWTRTVVGTGTVGALGYVDIRFNGTPTGSQFSIIFQPQGAVAASDGQSWTASIFHQLVAGSLDNAIGYPAANLWNSSNSYLSGLPISGSIIPSTTMQRFGGGATINQANTAFISWGITFVCTAGSTYDFTIRFAGPQLQTGSTLGPYVPTSTLAASSTADVWSITGADFSRIWNQSAVTLYADAGTPSAVPSGPFPRVVVADDVATRSNQVQLAYYSAGQVNFIRTAAGVQAEFYPSIFAQNYPKTALAVAADNIAGASNGTITGTDNAAIMPTVDRLLIGNENLSSNFFNGYIRELAIFRSRRPNANLQAMTS